MSNIKKKKIIIIIIQNKKDIIKIKNKKSRILKIPFYVFQTVHFLYIGNLCHLEFVFPFILCLIPFLINLC